ncbi:MAG: hypothetical protein GXO50_04050 [Chlorobi bacterium]|nr:hypothetical protein [Chlorobiota bacterium]
MKKIIFLSIIIFQFGFFAFSQSLKAEYQYLYLINKQDNEEIIKDNLRNAELVAYKITENPDNYNDFGTLFYIELARGYLKTEQYAKSVFTLARQILFFPDENNKNTEHVFRIAAEGANVKNIENSYKKLLQKSEAETFEKFNALFDLTLSEKLYETDDLLNEYIRLYRQKNTQPLPDRIKQYEFYTLIGIKNKDKFNMISYTEESDDFLHLHNDLTTKQKRKIINAAADYYIEIKNKNELKKTISEYKKIKKGIGGNFSLLYYKISYAVL